MFDPTKFTVPKAKPLPICLLLDISYSMSGDKINNLNKAVKTMIDSFATAEKMEIEILVSVITFGAEVNLVIPFTKASDIEWNDLSVNGATPMGTALKMAKAMIEDKNITPSRAYRPTIILVSDGEPNDSWEQPLNDFVNNGRSSKCDRMAMAIGSDANTEVLERFIEGSPHKLLDAENASKLHESFRYITMSVTMRTKSQNPNEIPKASEIKVEKEIEPKSIVEDSDDGYW